jgi:SAM-dependent methyltransferase
VNTGDAPASGDASTQAMRAFWDRRARENAMWYIHSQLDFGHSDPAEFWRSGVDNLEATLKPLGVEFRGDERVLEIGCGIGRMTRALAARAREVVAIDVSQEMVARAREALADLPSVSVRLGNGRDLAGVEDASVDACYSFIVFQHIPDPAVTCDYIAEMGRVLRPGGWAVFQVSDKPELHRRSTWLRGTAVRERVAGVLGRRPRGCLDPQWLGSALDRTQLDGALARGGLRLAGSSGDGTQFHLVHARKEAETQEG